MLSNTLLVVASVLSAATAHFSIEYPEMRGDSFATGASQWIYPCANVNQTEATNRTQWPLTGGAISLDLHHPWTYAFINLGLGASYPTFNISLTTQLLNVTGNGTFCLPQVKLPAGLMINEGQEASIQVVTSGESGSALYNCADITFTSKAPVVAADKCVNSTGVTGAIVAASNSSSSNTTSGTSSSKPSGTPSSTASGTPSNTASGTTSSTPSGTPSSATSSIPSSMMAVVAFVIVGFSWLL